MTLQEYDDAIEVLRRAKHQIVVNGRNLRVPEDVYRYGGTHHHCLAWRWLDQAERHLTAQLDAQLRGA